MKAMRLLNSFWSVTFLASAAFAARITSAR